MHDLLAYSSLYLGEGATMAAEAGVLGIPWIFVSRIGRGFLREQETVYGLGRTVQTSQEARDLVPQFVTPAARAEWKLRRDRLLAEKEDVVNFVISTLERCATNPNLGGDRRG